MMQDEIADNLQRIEERIGAAAMGARRKRSEITLIGVSKTQPAEAIRAAYDAGLRHFGENRVQEWEGKRAGMASLPGAAWHLIGHLQSNKAARAARGFHCVDAVDDLALAERLRRAWADGMRPEGCDDRKLRVLIELRVAEEESKSGVTIGELPALAEGIAGMAELELAGLMCVPPFLEDPELVRPYFARLREERDKLAARLGRELPVLSMGMSHDFAVAIEEGATEVRVGTALFGARQKLVAGN